MRRSLSDHENKPIRPSKLDNCILNNKFVIRFILFNIKIYCLRYSIILEDTSGN